MSKPESALIRCSVSSGMFPDEYAVEIQLSSNETISLFAEKDYLQNIDLCNHTAYLMVKLLNKQSNQGEELIFLPTESLEQGNRCVKVSGNQLVHL